MSRRLTVHFFSGTVQFMAKKVDELKRLISEEGSVAATSRALKVSRATIYNWLESGLTELGRFKVEKALAERQRANL